jgi:hypothetical protein
MGVEMGLGSAIDTEIQVARDNASETRRDRAHERSSVGQDDEIKNLITSVLVAVQQSTKELRESNRASEAKLEQALEAKLESSTKELKRK